jgi:hypothetical protein
MKTFIAVSSLIYKNKLVCLTTSKGVCLFNENGISSLQAVEFLHGLHRERKNKSNVVFICYAFSRDNEFIFSQLKAELKDKLFQSVAIKNQKETLELERESINQEYYQSKDKEQQDLLEFEFYVNTLNLKELETIEYYDYKLTLANGKFLTIRKGNKSITIYDVYKFFNKSVYDASNVWLHKRNDFLNLSFKRNKVFKTELDFLKAKAELETGVICELTEKLNSGLTENGFTLSRFHGASALSSNILSTVKAKDEFFSYRLKHQTSLECHKASKQSFYGARIEQFKIGTVKNVNVYDINSAYAYAMLFLPKMLRKPIFTNTYNNEIFSWWFVEYDFTDIKPYYGLLPNRDKKRNNLIQYKLKGKGYYYQPEIEFILKHYPNCIKIKQGFYVPFESANWTKEILAVYELRKELKKQNNPLEKVLKLALAGIYGKFCQHQGRSYYYNLYYAGFITSFIRAMLLQATYTKEQSVICFLTDAIHVCTNLDLPVSNEIGEYRLKEYDKATYFNAGVYRLIDKDGKEKIAHQGYNEFDFNNALSEIKDKKVFSGLQELFTGWNVFSEKRFGLHNYLEHYRQNKKTNPFDTFSRLFEMCNVDLSESYIDSKIVALYGGMESGLYKESKQNKESNFALDSIRAKRI